MNYKIFFVLIALVIFIIFILQNTALVTVSFLSLDITMPRSILLIITIALGILIGILLPVELRKSRTKK